jgi:formyltetrahydrofolate deformylase
MKNNAVLLVSCPDQKGLVATVCDFIFRHNGNIVHTDEHTDDELDRFLLRVEWNLIGFDLTLQTFPQTFAPIAERFQMQWRVASVAERPRMAVFVSKYGHCLNDLLYRQQSGELACDIPLILSNHVDCQRLADFYKIPFCQITVTKDNKPQAEAEQLRLLREHRVDLIVLARYMQVLSSNFIRQYPNRIINIHHSFLPAFVGAKPYHQAFERGVKLIGATSHYVTEVLDDGPIIEQDVARISHRDALDDLLQKGRDLEKVVLSRGVRWHLENRVLLYGNKTVVFQ